MAEVDQVLSALAALPEPPPEAEAERMVRALFEHAPGLWPLLSRDPSLAAEILTIPVARDRSADDYRSALSAATDGKGDGPLLFAALRRTRHREVLRIAAREVLGLADVDQTSAEMAWFAAATIDAALREVTRSGEEARGVARDRDGARIAQVVLGMGKLGGGELNVDSDVDLCFFYSTDDGEVGGGHDVTVHEHFAKIASRTSKALAEATEDGFVFRVDLRLRPEGSRGPLVNSLASAERYYTTYGRTWERAALLRARPVAGEPAFGDELLDTIRPFIYRRAVEPRVAAAMGEMLAKSRRDLAVDTERDVKLGHGGIREAEFFIQGLQLVWGGRHPELRVAGTVEAARRLLALGLLTEREAQSLTAAWALLRRVEHRVHIQSAYQTHAIPEAGAEREAFARSLGYDDASAFEAALASARHEVAALFATLTEGEEAAPKEYSRLADKVADGASANELRPDVEAALPSADPDEAAAHLVRLGRGPRSPLGPLARKERPSLGPLILTEAAESADPSAALRYLAELFSRLGATSGVSRVLEDDPRMTRRLIGLFGASGSLSESLVQRPELIHELLLRRGPPDLAEIAAVHGAPPLHWLGTLPEPEGFVRALRSARASLEVAIGIVTVAGDLAQSDAETLLSATADAQIGAALGYALVEQETRFGRPPPREGDGLLVLGLGKLGGQELGFGGDLDLIFLYRGDGETTGGEDGRSITAAELYTRAAQRTLRLLEEPSAFGRGYRTDARLRPSGAQGMLVVSIDAFDRYQRERGAAWERQALTRARPVAGSAALAEDARALVERHAFGAAPPPAEDVASMRRRMEVELAGERPGRYHPKLGYGGLVDVEFVVQWLSMRHGDDPTVRLANTRSALAALRAGGHLSEDDAHVLEAGQSFFRRVGQALALLDDTAEPVVFEGGRPADRVSRRLGLRDRDGERRGEVLFSTWKRHALDVRTVFERLVAPVGTHPPWEVP